MTFIFVTLLGYFLPTFCGLISMGITSLGDGITFQVLCYFFGLIGIIKSEHLNEIITEISMYGWPCALIQFYMTRKYVNWKISLILGPTSIITALIGAFILVGIQSVWLKRCVGLLILVSSIVYWIIGYYKDKTKKTNVSDETESVVDEYIGDDEDIEFVYNDNTGKYKWDFNDVNWDITNCENICKILILIGTALISGFLHGLFGVGGLPLMIFALITNIDKNVFRGSIIASFALFIHPITLFYLIYFGKQFNTDMESIIHYVLILLGSILGLFLGNILVHYVNQKLFRQCLQGLLLIGAILLCLDGFHVGLAIVSTVIVIITIIYILFICYQQGKISKNCLKKYKYTSTIDDEFEHIPLIPRNPN